MTSTTTWYANATLVITGLVVAVLPALVLHAMTAIMLIAATPALWLAYVIGWWALFSLLRVFASFIRAVVQIGPVTVLGLTAGSVTVITLLWPVFTGMPACSTCKPPELFAYRANLLCVAVAMHWSFLHWRGFRLTRRPSGPPTTAAELQR
ncbi:MAG: hypothetical protein V4844_18685 [Pseudomonadota bacterium]